jgi:ribosome-binding protein aMBF1 (putative translation factor)
LYNFSKSLGSKAFAKGYPANPRTMGERVRKARMDAGLSVKELAAHIGVSPDTVLNWELRGIEPRWHLDELQETLGMDG